MALIGGVNIPDGKRVEIALRSIFGIGPSLAKKVVEEVSISGNPKVQDIDEGQLAQLRDVVEKSFTLEGDLRRQTQLNIRRKIDIRNPPKISKTCPTILSVLSKKLMSNADGNPNKNNNPVTAKTDLALFQPSLSIIEDTGTSNNEIEEVIAAI